jgi:hypothetical protein
VVHALGPNEFPSADNDGLLPGTAFSLETANRMLPLVRSIVEEIVALNRLIQTQREQLRGIQERLGLPRADLYGEEVQDVRNSLRTDNRRLNDCIRELEALGMRLHRPIDGSVDFPGRIEQRDVYWCWTLGDQSIHRWRDRISTRSNVEA